MLSREANVILTFPSRTAAMRLAIDWAGSASLTSITSETATAAARYPLPGTRCPILDARVIWLISLSG
jgi:hypothetical protein